ncbi:unnamed protein product [Bursaphelenchus xylophilus]|uniref:(pine wood nematode) hypothetical protein n=1 Tax=Bursaphelenchus xylophilus TaxID=6326 RepID=A0A7I8X881_BURXY|nr:unnamed protein product [Bursaphelenchus xylophilus]CAG9125941.1 unnamed protein product [Bursaphelenchus xylophilus]
MGIFLNESDIPSAELLHFYVVFENTALGITVIMVPFTILVMVFTSNSVINAYRLLLINELSWSLVLDITAALIGAVSLFPLPCYYGVSVTSALSHTQQLINFVVGIGVLIMKDFSIFYQLEYILVKSLAMDSKIRTLFQIVPKSGVVLIHLGIIVSVLGAVLGPIIYYLPNQGEQKRLFISLDPFVGKLYEDHPDIICFIDGENTAKALIVGFIALSATPFIGLVFLIIMYNSMHQSNGSTHTYRLQKMLFRSLVFQLIAFTFLLCLPVMMLMSALLFQLRDGPTITVICFCFVLMHTPIDCFMILYFIKPYRIVVAHLLKVLQTAAGDAVWLKTGVHVLKGPLGDETEMDIGWVEWGTVADVADDGRRCM